MNQYCVVLPIRTGNMKEMLGNRVFNCKMVKSNNIADIYDDNGERKINEFCITDVDFVKKEDIEFKTDGSMWLR